MQVFVLTLLFNLHGGRGQLQNTSKTSFIICGEGFFKNIKGRKNTKWNSNLCRGHLVSRTEALLD